MNFVVEMYETVDPVEGQSWPPGRMARRVAVEGTIVTWQDLDEVIAHAQAAVKKAAAGWKSA